MFSIAKTSKVLCSVLRGRQYLPAIEVCTRFASNVRTNDVEGRDRLQLLGEKASYPNFKVTCNLEEFRKKWDYLQKGERDLNSEVMVAGRIISKRSAGSKLHFYDIRMGETMLQVMSSLNMYDNSITDPEQKKAIYKQVHKSLRTGDIIGIRGIPGRSDNGELSILPREITLLSPCLWKVPNEWYEIKDAELKYRKRYLDLIVSSASRNVFITRNKIIQEIRKFLTDDGFLEVETATLSGKAGGATATPFITHSESQDQDLTLRISPELYLKELVVGGFDRVFEIGKVFRNEGLDRKHNFEFTSIEAYMTYQDYTDWMKKTEQLFYKISTSVNNCPTIKIGDVEINFTPPYRTIDVTDELTRILGPLPNLNDENSLPKLLEICKERKIDVAKPVTLPRVLDTLIGNFIEPQCVQPTFIINHPMVMSPLSKEHGNTGKSERFELFVNGTEIVNAYTEQNDPVKQERSFNEQGKQREVGDKEIPPADATFINALEYGMAPTTGWGMGIDRFVMLMTNQTSIRDVILFPVLKGEK